MIAKRDYVYQLGFALAAVALTALIFLLNQYSVIPSNVPARTVLGHIFLDDNVLFLQESSNYAASFVCRSTHIWTAVFLPLLCSAPSLLTFASEMKGNYRLKLSRIGSFNRYWNKIFFRSGLSGAGCVTMGYMLFSAAVFAYFPHMSEYPAEVPIGADVFERMAVRKLLDGTLNKLFGNTESELLFWLPTAINVFAYSFLVAIICLALYLLIMNRYKAIGMPMIVFYLAEQFSTRKSLDTLNPKYNILSPRFLLINAEQIFSLFKINGLRYLLFFALFAVLIYFAGKELFRKRVMN